MKIIIMILFITFSYSNENYTILQELNKDITNNAVPEKIQLSKIEKSNETLIILKNALKKNDKILLNFKDISFNIGIDTSIKTLYNDPSEGTSFTLKNKKNKKLVLIISKYGSLDRYKFYFKYLKNKKHFYLESSYYLSFNKSCDHSLNAVYELKSILFDNILLKTFNKINFNTLLNTPIWINKEIKLEKIQSQEFLNSYNKILHKYKNKENFKDDIENLIVYGEKKCKPKYYINNKYFFKKNINKSNDIAFFFEQAGAYQEAIYLLEKIIEKYPNRTVAYINLGDSYLKDGNKEKAIENYKIYVKQMKQKNKYKKIPKRVLELVH